ncbi:MAG: transporter ATPase/permease [Acidobacteriaceae bacterium]|nr:transporter ATPase/permease [Acidobacteriaceae bacterium]
MKQRFRAVKFLLETGWRVDRWRTLGLSLEILAFIRAPLFAWYLRMMANGALRHDRGALIEGAVGITFAAVAGFAGLWFGSQMRIRLTEEVGFALNREIAYLVSTVPGLEVQERPEFQDQLELLNQGHGILGGSLSTLLNTARVILYGIGTVAALGLSSPMMLLIIPFALPTFAISTLQQRWTERAREASAEPLRRARHLLSLATNAKSNLELKLFGLQREIIARFSRDWTSGSQIILTARRRIALLAIGGDLFFLVGFVSIIMLMISRAQHHLASVGDVVLGVFLVQEIRSAVVEPARSAASVGETLNVVSRILWLKEFTERAIAIGKGAQPAPNRINHGIVFDNVSFQYPGTDRWGLRNVSFSINPGGIVAILGENGAGKTTLVKLLCRMYEPADGRILIDNIDLNDIEIDSWRSKLSGAFQDFARFEFTANQSVGLGDLSQLDNGEKICSAMDRSGNPDLLKILPSGGATQLGANWKDGVDLSTGQWQSIALGRAFMRDTPLMQFFDEPASSLDPVAEHELYARYTNEHRRLRHNGGVTLMISHRFSTVTAADLIVMIRDGSIVETGSHDELMCANGLYAELYRMQAQQYTSGWRFAPAK